MTVYDSSQLMNIVCQANARFSQMYGGLYNTNSKPSFQNVGYINLTSSSPSLGNPFLNNSSNFDYSTSNPFLGVNRTQQTNRSTNIGFGQRTTYLGSGTPSCLEAVRLAEAEYRKGVREIGSSNDSVDIRKYKNGAKNNHQWCCYFASWLYGRGQGTNNNSTFGFNGSTQAVKRKAINAGYYAHKNTGYTPKPGDLAMWTKTASTGHIGIVTKVYADGSFDVIEGNSGNKVAKHHYKSQNSVGRSFNGFVKMNEWTA